MEGVNEVYEPPTRRILARCVEDERRHIGAGLVVLRHLTTTPAQESRASTWRTRIESLLAASGGVTGRGLPPVGTGGPDPASIPLSDDAKEFIDLERAGARHAVPEDLESAIQRLGEALIAQDEPGVLRCFLPGVAPADGVASALGGQRLQSHRVVALASVGRQRLVKLRLEGPDGSVVLITRWAPGEDRWRAAALDLAAVDTARPA